METAKIIKGNTEQEVWAEIEKNLNIDEVDHYQVLIKQGDKDIEFIVDIDLGGGFEGGSQYAMLRSSVSVDSNFKFAIHNEDFIDEVGKFFGMQDVETGYEELDKHLVIKTNDENKVRRIFASDTVRNILIALDSFHCGIRTHNDDGAQQHFLELYVNENVDDLLVLKSLYKVFYNLLIAIEQPD
jgi:hypothetical protein